MFPTDITELAAALVSRCRTAGLMLATAESCTGGLLAGAVTDIAGASSVLERGFVTYSNDAKADLLGVDPALIANAGAVSAEVAAAMALGALAHSRAQIAVSVTGIAGPDGATPAKPVGLVYFAVARTGGTLVGDEQCFGDLGRDHVRVAAVRQALRLTYANVSSDG